MQRRDFIKACAALGVSASTFSSSELLADGGHGGLSPLLSDAVRGPMGPPRRLFINVIAHGGWDTTMLTDPKDHNYIHKPGTSQEEDRGPINNLTCGPAPTIEIEQAGNIVYPDYTYTHSNSGAVFNWKDDFFAKHKQRLLVLNGIATGTGNHFTGIKNSGSGIKRQQHPSLGALHARSRMPTGAMSYISYGKYDETRKLVPLTRINNEDTLFKATRPNVLAPSYTGSANFHGTGVLDFIRNARQARAQRLEAQATLPKTARHLEMLGAAQLSGPQLETLMDHYPSTAQIAAGDFADILSADFAKALKKQARMAIAAYKAGLCTSANLFLSSFDTHANHDVNQLKKMATLLAGLDFLIEEALAQGVYQEMVVLVNSEFTRTPYYNATNGKDHWTSNSALLFGAGIVGNRVMGQTDEQLVGCDTSGTRLTYDNDPSNQPITMEAVHYALREQLQVEQSLRTKFPLSDPSITGYARADFFPPPPPPPGPVPLGHSEA
jgi:hypothetical protein